MTPSYATLLVAEKINAALTELNGALPILSTLEGSSRDALVIVEKCMETLEEALNLTLSEMAKP